ncbi:hypothetical protein M409DRAFT_37660 [Zasmidium cellare ATCC 36951]|uniref:O-methyltransferase C-terminal domain-containing protein n=1 Tax=Zasmidium cellare ATCC 36951 TaxID=1080233 RepID=A0A6A6C582_ZASCE|nr:uncharacterized protein M409DRAFT_37660 [Zasmidium cellare ATCC 36951]KAF2160899.1 hypothetical protein M409DRAFT_37660 [Zasmidium cellare ATCC 36951]
MPPSRCSTELDQFWESLNTVDDVSFTDESQRLRAVDALGAALRRVQRPAEVVWEQLWADPAVLSAIVTLIEAEFWTKWGAAGGESATSDELARMGAIDVALLSESCVRLRCSNLIRETKVDTYALTAYSAALTDLKFANIYACGVDAFWSSLMNFPRFASKTGYRNPSDADHTNFHDWSGGESFFGYLAASPRVGASFNDAMTMYTTLSAPWTEVYPLDSIAGQTRTDMPVLVDVGGGVGHDLEILRSHFPDLPQGSLVLQDLAPVIARAQVASPVEALAHDFFTPQPIKGASFYFLHSVLHDWPDPEAVKILQNLVPAMDKSHSRILLHEAVIPPLKANSRNTVSDMFMMCLVSAHERTEQMWSDVVESAGLRIRKIYTSRRSTEAIIEIELH